MDTTKGTDQIIIQPHDSGVTYAFTSSPCSSAASNDGNIPYGTTVSGVEVLSANSDGEVITGLIDDYSVTDNVISVTMSYPDDGAGNYHLTFLLTLDNGSIVEEDYNRVKAVDL